MALFDVVWLSGLLVDALLLLISLGVIVFWLRMVYDCLQRGFSSSMKKVLWLIILILSIPIGAAAYYYFVFRGTDFFEL